jgi:methyl-accepting chemotaxis protein
VTWHPEEGQPDPGRGLAILATGLALALGLLGAAVLLVEFSVRSSAALPRWVAGPALAWLGAHGLPLVAAGALVIGVFSILAVRAARHAAGLAHLPAAVDDGAVERLRRQVEPLATGDLDVWLPEAEGAVGEINRTLNLLVGGVSDLVAATDEASVQLLGAVQDGRSGLAGMKVEAERARKLADEVLERARQAVLAAQALGGRVKVKAPPAKAAAPNPAQPTGDDPVARAALASRLEDIVEVMRDLAEQAHVLAVGISVQAGAADAPAALAGVGDEVRQLAEQAGRAVARIDPLARAALDEARGAASPHRGLAVSDRLAGGSAAGRRVAEQVATLAELAASLRTSADRLAHVQDEAATSLAALVDLAHRLRRATGRFRLPS